MDQTVGTTLRQTREAKRLTLDQVFEATKIRLPYLQAIENDRLEQLPSRAQARGFIRLYANFLGLDAYELLDALQAVEQPIPQKPEPKPVIEKTTPAEPEPSNKEVIDYFVQQSKKKISGKVKEGSDRLQGSLQHLTEKIPYRIVKKGEEPLPADQPEQDQAPAEPTAALTQRPANRQTYQAMSRAIGADLRKRRESLGLSLADIERQTRIREIYIYALEEGNLDDLPSTVQGRGMLGNYAAFMDLDSEAFLARFAEALQQKRLETLPEEKAGIPLPTNTTKQALTGWRRFLSPDLIFTGGLFLVFFVFIIWGAAQLIGINSNSPSSTAIPISDLLLASGTPSSAALVTVEGATPQTTDNAISAFTPVDNLQATLEATTTNAIQLVIVAHHRAYMKITVDNKDAFVGLVVPGTIYSYSGNSTIVLLTGDGSALEAYYNQNDLGILGNIDQVINLQFSAKGYVNLGAQNTATPAPSVIPSLTPNPTATPTETPALPSPTPTLESTTGIP